jgi:hypothetical protein
MSCCHADFATVEGSDRGFTIGTPTFTFGPGVLAEAGDHARELGMRRVALFTDAGLRRGEYVATVSGSLASAGIDATVYGDRFWKRRASPPMAGSTATCPWAAAPSWTRARPRTSMRRIRRSS